MGKDNYLLLLIKILSLLFVAEARGVSRARGPANTIMVIILCILSGGAVLYLIYIGIRRTYFAHYESEVEMKKIVMDWIQSHPFTKTFSPGLAKYHGFYIKEGKFFYTQEFMLEFKEEEFSGQGTDEEGQYEINGIKMSDGIRSVKNYMEGHSTVSIFAHVVFAEAHPLPYIIGFFQSVENDGVYCLFPVEEDCPNREALEAKIRKIPLRHHYIHVMVTLGLILLLDVIAIIITLVKFSNIKELKASHIAELPIDTVISVLAAGFLIFTERFKPRNLLDPPNYAPFYLSVLSISSHMIVGFLHVIFILLLHAIITNNVDQNAGLCLTTMVISGIHLILWPLYLYYEREGLLLRLRRVGDWMRENLYFEQTFLQKKD